MAIQVNIRLTEEMILRIKKAHPNKSSYIKKAIEEKLDRDKIEVIDKATFDGDIYDMPLHDN